MARLKSDEDFYGTALSKFTETTMDPSNVHDFWLTAADVYAVPPRGSHEGAVAALSLYAEEAANENLEALAGRWVDMSIVDELYPTVPAR